MEIHFYSRKRKQSCPKVNDCSKIKKEKDRTKVKGIIKAAGSMCVMQKVHGKGISNKKSYL